MRTKPIVVGVDGSGWSESALGWAADEARRRRLPLIVLHAFEWPVMGVPLSGVPAGYDPREVARRMLLESAARARSRAAGLEVTSRMDVGAAAPRLLAAARGAAMLVVGSRGLGGFSGLLAGSVSLHLAEHAPCPVVVVRADGPARIDGPIVLGVDGPAADPAAAWAFDEAARRGATLLAVHAWPAGTGGAPDLADPDEEETAARVYEQLGGWQRKYPEVPLERVDARGHPAALLAEQGVGAQLTVVGARGRGGFRGLLLGSTSQALLRHAYSPVAVVRDAAPDESVDQSVP